MADIIIKNGYVLTQDKYCSTIEDGAVAIQADRILEMGKASELEKRHRASKVIDARMDLECWIDCEVLDDIGYRNC